MLIVESLAALLCIGVAAVVLKRISAEAEPGHRKKVATGT
jgi:hypothetical protein